MKFVFVCDVNACVYLIVYATVYPLCECVLSGRDEV